MGSIGRYIFRITFGAFLLVCACVTALMWITQALRDVDLMTNQGQSILVFVGITSLIIPLLLMIIAPVALMIAVAYVLNKLGNDSELIVMNSAGMPPKVLFMPFFVVGVVVSRVRHGAQRLSLALGPARAAALGDRGPRRSRQQHHPARPLHPHRKRADAAYPRAAAEQPVARHLHRRPARSQGPHDDSRRAGRDPQERRQRLSRARTRQRAAARDRQARSHAGAVRELRLRPVAPRRRPEEHQVLDPRALSLGAGQSEAGRSAVRRPAGPGPRRISRPPHRAALSRSRSCS